MKVSMKIELDLKKFDDLVKKYSKNKKGISQSYLRYFFKQAPYHLFVVHNACYYNHTTLEDICFFEWWVHHVETQDEEEEVIEEREKLTNLQRFVREILMVAKTNPKWTNVKIYEYLYY